MTPYTPHGRYDYCTDIKAVIFGIADDSIILFPDFECQVEVECELSGSGFDLTTTCIDVLVDGYSLRNGDDLAKAIRSYVMAEAQSQLDKAGALFDAVREAEGLSITGHPNDPDTHWQQAW